MWPAALMRVSAPYDIFIVHACPSFGSSCMSLSLSKFHVADTSRSHRHNLSCCRPHSIPRFYCSDWCVCSGSASRRRCHSVLALTYGGFVLQLGNNSCFIQHVYITFQARNPSFSYQSHIKDVHTPSFILSLALHSLGFLLLSHLLELC